MYNKQLAKEWEDKGYLWGTKGKYSNPPGFYLLPSYIRYHYKVGLHRGLSDLRKSTLKEDTHASR